MTGLDAGGDSAPFNVEYELVLGIGCGQLVVVGLYMFCAWYEVVGIALYEPPAPCNAAFMSYPPPDPPFSIIIPVPLTVFSLTSKIIHDLSNNVGIYIWRARSRHGWPAARVVILHLFPCHPDCAVVAHFLQRTDNGKTQADYS